MKYTKFEFVLGKGSTGVDEFPYAARVNRGLPHGFNR